SGKWKAVRQGLAKGAGGVELYDLESDLSEKKDVAMAHPDIVERLVNVMKEQPTRSDDFPLQSIDPPAKKKLPFPIHPNAAAFSGLSPRLCPAKPRLTAPGVRLTMSPAPGETCRGDTLNARGAGDGDPREGPDSPSPWRGKMGKRVGLGALCALLLVTGE